MENIDDLIRKFHLQIETYTPIADATYTALLDLAKDDAYWRQIFALDADGNQLKEFFAGASSAARERYFHFGVSCFLCFVQKNFTGPPIGPAFEAFLAADRFAGTDFAARLSLNNEDINVNARHPALLVVAEIIFDCCIVNNLVNLWWCCRALMIHQDILDELSPTLLSNADRLYKLIQTVPLAGNLKAELDIELAQLYLKFRNITKSKEHITSATEILGLVYNLIGRMGKRTRFQSKELAQLALMVSLKEKEDISRQEVDILQGPLNVPLNDDTRLDKVEFTKQAVEITSEATRLPYTEQKLVLTSVQQTLIASPADELLTEELRPFIDVILEQNNTYAVKVMALMIRFQLENFNRRTIERSISQCEEIINCYTKEEPHALSRIGDVFSTSFLPIWTVEAQFGELLLSFGLVKNSLDIFLRIKLWEEVIICYTLMKLRHKATEIIKEQLEAKPTVKLMCLLGDSTDDVACYEKAWEMSKKRSHRAQRQWGNHFFDRKKYAEAVPHFEKSLSINPLQAAIWFRLGFAALQIENWQTAATAYRRYTTLEPNGFEAWNNLAQAYIKIGNKRSAHHAILEALKCNFENWKVWENLLVISCDIAHYSDVIRAYHRLLDLKDKYLNIDVLNLLVYSVANNCNDFEGTPTTKKYIQRTRELLGRIASLYAANGAVWELYASLAPAASLKAQRLQRAFKGYTQGQWQKNTKSCGDVLNVCTKLVDLALSEEFDEPLVRTKSIKLNVSSAISALKKLDWEASKDRVQELQEKLYQLMVKIVAAEAEALAVGEERAAGEADARGLGELKTIEEMERECES